MSLFFRQRKPRSFNYTPRYYDRAEEAREERKKQVLGDRYAPPAGNGEESAYRPGEHVRRNADARRAASGPQGGFTGFATERGRTARGRGRPTLTPLIIMLILLALAVWAMFLL